MKRDSASKASGVNLTRGINFPLVFLQNPHVSHNKLMLYDCLLYPVYEQSWYFISSYLFLVYLFSQAFSFSIEIDYRLVNGKHKENAISACVFNLIFELHNECEFEAPASCCFNFNICFHGKICSHHILDQDWNHWL